MPQVSADNDVFVGDCVNGPASQDHLIPGANKRIAMHSRLLFFLPDGHPTFRPDVAALFGEYLPRQGVTSDIVTTAASDGVAPPWGGGEAFLSVAHGGKVRGILNSTINNIKALLRLRRGGYGAVQVRDQIFIAPFALMGARLCGLPFFYWMSFPISESKLRLASDYRFSGQPIRWLSWVLRGWIGIQLLYRVILPSADSGSTRLRPRQDVPGPNGHRSGAFLKSCVAGRRFVSRSPRDWLSGRLQQGPPHRFSAGRHVARPPALSERTPAARGRR